MLRVTTRFPHFDFDLHLGSQECKKAKIQITFHQLKHFSLLKLVVQSDQTVVQGRQPHLCDFEGGGGIRNVALYFSNQFLSDLTCF